MSELITLLLNKNCICISCNVVKKEIHHISTIDYISPIDYISTIDNRYKFLRKAIHNYIDTRALLIHILSTTKG